MNERLQKFSHQIFRSDLWNIGPIGIFEKRIDKTNMNEGLKNTIKWTGRIVGLYGAARLATSCDAFQPTITADPGGNNNNSSEFDQNKPKTGEEWQKESLASFLSSKPEYQGREMFAINIRFPLKGYESNTVVITPNESEKVTIESYKYKFDGKELRPYTDAIVYTMKTDINGKTEWVRLAGVWFPTEDGSVNTAWYYSRDAFKPDVNTVNFNQRVLGFNSNSDQFVFWPLVEPPYTLDWSENIGSTDVSQFSPWNGIDPYTFSLGTIPTGFNKVLFAPVPFDAPTQTATAKPEETATETSTARPAVEAIDISNPEKFRKEKWDYLISSEYLAELQRKEKAGELPSVSKDAVYVKPGFVSYHPDNVPSNVVKKYGIGEIFSLSNEEVYLDKSKRPFVTVDAFKTEFLGINMIVIVDKWENPDHSVAFKAQIIFDYNFTKELLESLQDASRYPTGGYFIKESERGDGCEAFINQLAETEVDSSKFCAYYYSNPEIFLASDIYKNWQTTGILDTKGVLLISAAATNKIGK